MAQVRHTDVALAPAPPHGREGVRGPFGMPIPKQYGAWSVLLAAFVVGAAAAGGVGAPGLLLLFAAILAFVARYAAGLYLRQRRVGDAGDALGWTIGLSLTSLLLGAFLVGGYHRWLLVPLGAVAAGFAAASLLVERARKDRTTYGELLAVCGLSLVVPAAAYAISGEVAGPTLGFWALSALLFCGSVFHVRYLVRHRTAGPGRLGVGLTSAGFHLAAVGAAVALAAAGTLPAAGVLALLPAAGRALWAVGRRRATPIPIRRIGYTEVVHTVIFVGLAIYAARAVGGVSG